MPALSAALPAVGNDARSIIRGAFAQKRYPHQDCRKAQTHKGKNILRAGDRTPHLVLNVQSGNSIGGLCSSSLPLRLALDTYIDKITSLNCILLSSPSQITFDPKKPVTLGRLGWGTFRIDITVYWKKFGHSDFVPRPLIRAQSVQNSHLQALRRVTMISYHQLLQQSSSFDT